MKVLSLDTETSIQKGHWGADARCPDNDFYTMIWADHPDNVEMAHQPSGFSRQLPEEVCSKLEITDYIVGVNLGFDLRLMWNHNPELKNYFIRGGRLWDCQVAEYILTAQQHCFASLGELQEKYLGQEQKVDRISRLYQKKIGADRIIAAKRRCPRLWTLYEQYCTIDGVSPLHIFKAQYMKAKEEGMLNIIILYQDYLTALINISSTGIKVDLDRINDLEILYQQKHLDSLEKAQDILKKVWTDPRLPEFKVSSTDDRSLALFGGVKSVKIKTQVGFYQNGNPKFKQIPKDIEVKGFGVDKSLTKEAKKLGVYSTAAEYIDKIKDNSKNQHVIDFCTHQADANHYSKMITTYLHGLKKWCVNNYLYPKFNNCLVPTGRLSSSEPNVQNQPKHSDFGKLLHEVFVAPGGYICVSIDYCQLEMWGKGYVSQDKKLLADLLNGIDFHCKYMSYYIGSDYETCFRKAKIEKIPEWVDHRSKAKTVNFRMGYGGGVKSMAKATGLREDDVKNIFKGEAEEYPEAAGFGEKVKSVAEHNKRPSEYCNIPYVMRKSRKFTENGYELMPKFDKEGKLIYTNISDIRFIGYWQSPTGKKYHFIEEPGTNYRTGKPQASIPLTRTKNYFCQGIAADIQAATTAELLKACLTRPDKIKMINEVHDSKWFYIKEDEKDVIIPWIVEIMEDIPKIFLRRFGLKVPFKFPVDVEIGNNFAEMHTYNIGG